MKLAGIDYGARRVGVALSDDAGVVAFPHAVLENTKRLAEEVGALCQEAGVGAVVIGESRDYKQRENPIAEAARAFARSLADKTGLPVYFEPEVLTSAEARRAPHKKAPMRKPDTPESVDAKAAAIILQSYIDKQQNRQSPDEA